MAYQPSELAEGVDTLIKRAEQLLREGLPAEQVPYEVTRPSPAADAPTTNSARAQRG